MSAIRFLVVDDFEEWRLLVSTLIEGGPNWQVVGTASDGLEAVQKAQELKPDLILLDIGLPKLNGIEAARQIRRLSPNSKILFLSENRTPEIVAEALRTGASGYVVKSDARSELLIAADAVIQGERFVGKRLQAHPEAFEQLDRDTVLASLIPTLPRTPKIAHSHEVHFCSHDSYFLDSFAHFIETCLNAKRSVVVVATKSHREGIFSRLHTALDIAAATEQGRYITLDVEETLARFMINDLPDPVLFFEAVGDLVASATKAATADDPRVAACGECAPFLWAQGRAEAAIRVEQLWDQIAAMYHVKILCAYPSLSFQTEEDRFILQRICAEHSAVYSR
jgi:DNA-binding NarL/FixJ family response regulator